MPDRSPRRIPASTFSIRQVVFELLTVFRPWLIWFAVLGLVCGGVSLWLGAPALSSAAGILLLHVGGGLVGSFLVHEAAHATGMKLWAGQLKEVAVVRGFAHFSLIPRGSVSGISVAATALAGPGASMVLGVLLWGVVPGLHLHWWYWVHLLMLLPIFGDGQALLRGLVFGRRRISLQGYQAPSRTSQTH